MDDVQPRPRRQRPKDSFQNELQAKLHQRRSLGLSAEVTDSEDEALGQSHTSSYLKSSSRPAAAVRRQPDLSRGLGTTTMRSRDLTSLMGRDVDDDDEEIVAANLGRASPGGTWTPGSKKTPSPTLYGGRKTPTASQSPTEKLDSIFGRKTPTQREASPKSGLSKEDIIFGRKTPTDGRKTPSGEGKRSPSDSGLRGLPGVEGKWQPPNFRSASPGSSDHSRGSRGVTPVDSTLDTISESSRGGQRLNQSRQAAVDEKPKPRARGGGGRTPPIGGDPRRSPAEGLKEGGGLRRASPTTDLFGGRSRMEERQEVDGYMDDRKYKSKLGRSPSPDGKKGDFVTSGRKTPVKEPASRFSKDGRKTPTDKISDRKTPTSFDRKTPTYDRKTPTSFDRKVSLKEKEKEKSIRDKKEDEILKEKASAMKGQSLLDFLTEDATAAKPEPKSRRRRDEADDDIDDIFTTNKRMLGKQTKSPPRSPRRKPTKATAEDLGETPEPPTLTLPKKPSDTSSVCEEVPLDPNRKLATDAEKAAKSGKQTTERAKADSAIETIAGAQTMQYIEPAKKIRPVTASAKVQHRPKPRYGTLMPGETAEKTLQERQFTSTGDIRDAIYEEWYADRIKQAKKKKKEEEKAQKEKEEKEKQEKKDKRLESEASYRAWMNKKKEVILEEEAKKRRQQKEKEKKEEEEKKEKAIESMKSFQHWKENKDQRIKNQMRKKREEEAQKKENEEYERKMKNKDRESAFKGWQNRKEKEWTNETLKKKEENKKKKQKEKEEAQKLKDKEMDAMDQYYDWMEKKEKQQRLEKKRAKQRRLMGEDDYKPAWSPASRTIPFGS